jgi:2-oxoisovalerate dehydrogenase E1 component
MVGVLLSVRPPSHAHHGRGDVTNGPFVDGDDRCTALDATATAGQGDRVEQVPEQAREQARESVDAHFLDAVKNRLTAGPARALGPHLTPERALALFDGQLRSRHLDLAARWLRGQGAGWYTIGSSGHEGNVAVAAALRPTDPALLHYRSGGFYLERAPGARLRSGR